MPQGEWEKSLVANGYPLLPDDAQIVLQDDVGVDNPLDANEVSIVPRRELVSLDNASVNIDNSNDVIIGPVTQFNVTGNVIIRQRENERPSQGEDNEGDGVKSKTGATIPASGTTDSKELRKRKTIIKLSLWISLAILLLTGITTALAFALRSEPAPDVITPPAPRPISGEQPYQFYRREDWGARSPKWRENVTKPVDLVIIKHTGGRTCSSFQDCAPLVQTLQSLSVQRGNPDIYCSFLIGMDGNVYEGRGWGVQPQERNNTYDIVFMGTFDIDVPEKRMFGAAQALLQDGVKKGYLIEDYKVVCHSQTKNTMSPGSGISDEVKKWSHYDPNMYFPNVLMSQYGENSSRKKLTKR